MKLLKNEKLASPNLAILQKIVQAKEAAAWAIETGLNIDSFDFSGALPVMHIEEPNAELEMERKAYKVKEHDCIIFVFELHIKNVKVALVHWRLTNTDLNQ